MSGKLGYGLGSLELLKNNLESRPFFIFRFKVPRKKIIAKRRKEMKKDINLLFDLLRADGSIVINKKLARGIGIQPAIMYSELLSKYKYFADRDMLKDGWFFNSIENMRKDTCLSEYQQREAIGKLRELGLIEYKLNGMPATRYFKIVKSGKLYEILKSETAPQTSSEETKELIPKNYRVIILIILIILNIIIIAQVSRLRKNYIWIRFILLVENTKN